MHGLKKCDVVYCKKTFKVPIGSYKKGMSYIIVDDSTAFDIPIEPPEIIIFNSAFYMEPGKFKEHFLTQKQLRKLKLDEINKNI